jgi:hypothetical protein
VVRIRRCQRRGLFELGLHIQIVGDKEMRKLRMRTLLFRRHRLQCVRERGDEEQAQSQ